jgi:DNA-binding NarL/FixJ family response regulator
MISIDVLVSSPVFLTGLIRVLADSDITVIATRTSPVERPSSQADAIVIDSDALTPPHDVSYIREMSRSAKVLVLYSELERERDMYVRAGAAGAVSKLESCESIVRAVRAVTGGGLAIVDASDVEPAIHTPAHLSPREEQVLGRIAQGLTHTQIATRLGISPHTVDTYVKRIRAKLGLGNKAELTRAAMLRTLAESVPSG